MHALQNVGKVSWPSCQNQPLPHALHQGMFSWTICSYIMGLIMEVLMVIDPASLSLIPRYRKGRRQRGLNGCAPAWLLTCQYTSTLFLDRIFCCSSIYALTTTLLSPDETITQSLYHAILEVLYSQVDNLMNRVYVVIVYIGEQPWKSILIFSFVLHCKLHFLFANESFFFHLQLPPHSVSGKSTLGSL